MYWGNYFWLIISQLCGSYFELESFLTLIFISKYANWQFSNFGFFFKKNFTKEGHMLQSYLVKYKSEAHITCPFFV